jgi:hypothetical protein
MQKTAITGVAVTKPDGPGRWQGRLKNSEHEVDK